ncbi:ferrochelatase [Roseomonas sp. 18066]|uniref:ferrochelatase n=1 Tax=Roseomonas sp. 18066 TaxID=2681412 RepID=UPI001358E0C2|nr:ferrochelatase [Roseomonas sp. 18066]
MSFINPPTGGVLPDAFGTRTGVLLVNLGTPDSTGYWDLRRYLSEFLSDRRVIELCPFLWQGLLQGIILSKRPQKSGALYRRIWNNERNESPLRTYTRAQAEKLRAALGEGAPVIDWAMRYGKPSVEERMLALQEAGCDRVLLLPLYPQYSAPTTATVNDAAFRALLKMRRQPVLRIAPPFPDHPRYIAGLAQSVRDALAPLAEPPQKIVVSFHGLPLRYVKNGDPYVAECERTITALRAALGHDAGSMPLTFQSRFGREPWLEPYTDEFVTALPAQGVTRIAVITPGFMADCIETLDEIGNELREEFEHAGGKEMTVIPCLNDTPAAIDLLQEIVATELSGWR